jgi:hypothetical protein
VDIQTAAGVGEVADAGTEPVLFVIIAPVVPGVMPLVHGHFASETDARARGRELGGGYVVARFGFTADPHQAPRTALEALHRQVDRQRRGPVVHGADSGPAETTNGTRLDAFATTAAIGA